MSARDQVLQTYELLENVLLHLPLIDIINAQRVSSQWHHMVDHSDPIRKVLYRTSIDGRAVSFTGRSYFQPPSHRVFGPGLDPAKLPSWRSDDGPAFPILNPFIARFIHRTGHPAALLQNFIEKVCTSNVNLTFSPDALPVSWKSMYLLQPPAMSLQYRCTYRGVRCSDPALRSSQDWIHSPNGITLFDVAQSAREHRKWCPSCPILSMMPGSSMFLGVEWTSTVYLSITGWEMLDRLAVGTSTPPE